MEGLLKIFEQQVLLNKNKTAIICGGQKLSYEGLYFKSYSLSIFFKNEGIKAGDKVFVKVEETPFYWAIYFATLLAGGVFVALDKNIPDNTFCNIVKELDGCFAYISNSMNENCNYKHFSYEEVISHSDENLPRNKIYNLYHDIEPDRLVQIIFTTGTTGNSKGVMLPYDYSLESAFECEELPYNQNTVMAIVAPLDHAMANRALTVLLHSGTAIQFNNLSNPEFFYEQVITNNVNSFVLSPSAIKYLSLISSDLFKQICENAEFFEIGGEKMPEKNQEELLLLAPKARIFIGYASTECGPIGFYEFSKYGTTENRVGKLNGNPGIALFDDNYNMIDVKKDISGHIGIKKRYKYLGYYNSSTPNLLVKDNYIVLTDYGHIDDEGFLCLDGRDGETIISGGYKINPVEVENICLKHDLVDECVCYGITNDIFGKIVALDVVCKKPLDIKDLNEHLLKYLEINKMPKVINIVDKIAKNKMGKIDRKFYKR